MTPVMQLIDVGVAFNLKKIIEAVKEEVRREKRGSGGIEAAFEDNIKEEVKCSTRDLMRILAESLKRLVHQDEVEDPQRLLRQARACGWLSYRADLVRKALVRCDEEDWMKGREQELLEETHRHPRVWWSSRYEWKNEEGEPLKPDYNQCGRSSHGLEHMRDEFPEGKPNAQTRLNCLIGTKVVRLHDVDLSEEGMTFDEVGANLVPDTFLRTQREKYEAARLRAICRTAKSKTLMGNKLSVKMRRKKMRVQLVNSARKKALLFRQSFCRVVVGWMTPCLITTCVSLIL